MFNFRNRKRFGEEDVDDSDQLLQEEECAGTEVGEGGAQDVVKQSAEYRIQEPQSVSAEACCAKPVSVEPAPQQEAAEKEPAAEPVETEDTAERAEKETNDTQFAAYENAGKDVTAFSMEEAFSGFNAEEYSEEIKKEPTIKQEEETVINVEMIAPEAQEEGKEASAEVLQTRTETIAEVEIRAEENGKIETAPEEVQADESAAAQYSAFNAQDYTVNLNYKDKSVFEVDYKELAEEELPEFIDASRNIIRMMALNTNNLINLVQRKNKRIAQYEEVSKLLESNQRDFENYKRRNAELEKKAKDEGFVNALQCVLPTLDNFDRAIAMIPDPASAEGVVMIQRQLHSALEKLGVEEIDAVGKEFDPNYHNAVMQQETDDDALSDKVVEVFQKGYVCGDKVLRYAQVKVAKKY